MPARPGYLHTPNPQAALRAERAELLDLLEDISLATDYADTIKGEDTLAQMVGTAFILETLGRSLRFRAEHGLF